VEVEGHNTLLLLEVVEDQEVEELLGLVLAAALLVKAIVVDQMAAQMDGPQAEVVEQVLLVALVLALKVALEVLDLIGNHLELHMQVVAGAGVLTR